MIKYEPAALGTPGSETEYNPQIARKAIAIVMALGRLEMVERDEIEAFTAEVEAIEAEKDRKNKAFLAKLKAEKKAKRSK